MGGFYAPVSALTASLKREGRGGSEHAWLQPHSHTRGAVCGEHVFGGIPRRRFPTQNGISLEMHEERDSLKKKGGLRGVRKALGFFGFKS